MEVLAEQMAVVVVVAAPLQVRLGGMGLLAAQARAEMVGHQAPLRAVQAPHPAQAALALLVLAAAAQQELAAQVAPEQSGHKPQTARPLALAAVAAEQVAAQ